MTGVPEGRLAEIPGFPESMRYRLRDELSVTSNAQFLDLSSRYAGDIANLLGIDEQELDRLRTLVSDATPPESSAGSDIDAADAAPAADYPYMTGHDAPPDGQEVFGPPDKTGATNERSEDGPHEVQRGLPRQE